MELDKFSLIMGKPETATLSKALAVSQLQRLSERTQQCDATVCSHANMKHERRIRRGSSTAKAVVTIKVTQPLWDGSNTFTTASTTILTFFSTAQSGIGGNLVTAGLLAFPTSFIIRAIRFIPQIVTSYQTTAAVVNSANDIGLLIFNGYFTLGVLSKEYLRLPLFMLPAGAGVWGTIAGNSTAPAFAGVSSNGVPDPRSIWTMLDPLWLETQVSFTATATWNGTQSTAASPKIFLVFDGQKIQPVQ